MAISRRFLLATMLCAIVLTLFCMAPTFALAGESSDETPSGKTVTEASNDAPDTDAADEGDSKGDDADADGQSDEGADIEEGGNSDGDSGADEAGDANASSDEINDGDSNDGADGDSDADDDTGSNDVDADDDGNDSMIDEQNASGDEADGSGDVAASEMGDTDEEAGDDFATAAEPNNSAVPADVEKSSASDQNSEKAVDTNDDVAVKTALTTSATTTKTVQAKKAKSKAKKSKPYLKDGKYVINIDKQRNLMLDIVDGSKKAKVKALMKTESGKKSQQWVFRWVERFNAYVIRNAKSNLYLTNKEAKSGKELVWQMKRKKDMTLQLWTLQRNGGGFKILSYTKNSLGLGTWSTKAKDGYYITTQKGADNKFKFYILPVTDDLMKPEATVPSDLDGKFVKVAVSTKSSLKLGIEGNDMKSGAKATANKNSSSTNQKWYLKAVNKAEGVYKILNIGSGKALQIASKTRHVDTKVSQGNVKDSELQLWWVRENTDGTFSFTSCYNGLTLHSNSLKNGSEMTVTVKKGTKNRTFAIEETAPIDSGVYQIGLSKNSDLSLSVPDANQKYKTQLQTKKYNAQLWQKFVLDELANGVYAIRSVTSNRLLGEVGGNVIQGTRADKKSQSWKLVWKDTGYVLQNMKSGNYLRVSGKLKDGATLITHNKYNAAKEQLVFTKRHLVDDGAYYITPGNKNSKAIGVKQSGLSENNTGVGIYKKVEAQNQKFKIKYIGKDSDGNEIYQITNAFSNKGLEASGNKLYQNGASKADSQKWKAIVTKSGMLAFVNKGTGKAIYRGKNDASTASFDPSGSVGKYRWSVEPTIALNALQLTAYKKLIKTYSNTNYAITTDLKNHRVMVFERENSSSPWSLKFDWICSNGKAETPTPAVNKLSSGYKRYKNPALNPEGIPYQSAFYYMTYIGSGKYYHTPLYQKGSKSRWRDKRMGRSISNGCVRVHTKNAIWIYKHIKKGTRIITYYH